MDKYEQWYKESYYCSGDDTHVWSYNLEPFCLRCYVLRYDWEVIRRFLLFMMLRDLVDWSKVGVLDGS